MRSGAVTRRHFLNCPIKSGHGPSRCRTALPALVSARSGFRPRGSRYAIARSWRRDGTGWLNEPVPCEPVSCIISLISGKHTGKFAHSRLRRRQSA
jgi:hypothetical protein